MKSLARLATGLTLSLVVASFVVAGALTDVRMETRQDDEGNTRYMLTNTGHRTVHASVEMLKDCTGNQRKSRVRTFTVHGGSSIQVARAAARTNCRHSYRIVEARYR